MVLLSGSNQWIVDPFSPSPTAFSRKQINLLVLLLCRFSDLLLLCCLQGLFFLFYFIMTSESIVSAASRCNSFKLSSLSSFPQRLRRTCKSRHEGSQLPIRVTISSNYSKRVFLITRSKKSVRSDAHLLGHYPDFIRRPLAHWPTIKVDQ